MKQILLVIIAFLASHNLYAQNENSIDWNSDLDFLANELIEKHYNFFTIQSKENFLAGIEAIKSESKNLSNLHIAMKTQQLIAQHGDSHTMLSFTQLLDRNQLLPLNLYWTSDGLHIIKTTRDNEELIGSRLITINKVPVEKIIDSISTLLTVDNQATVKQTVPQLISSIQILEYFGFVTNQEIELEVETSTKEKLTHTLKPAPINPNEVISIKPDSVAFCIKNQQLYFTDCYYPGEKTYHILYNRCSSKEIELEYGNKERAEKAPSFKEFEKKIFSVLKENPVDKIIFDMRFNGGGNSLQGTEFIKKLAKFLKKNPHIQTYVVLGRATFSSAILNSMDFKQLTNAIFVGEETAGKPNHFGEVKGTRLPNSNVNLQYSIKYFKNTEEDLNTITPDIPIEMSFSDLMKGIDPVFEWIKQQD